MEGLQDGLKDGSVEVASAAKSFVKTPCEPGMTAHTAIPVLRKTRIFLSSRSSRTRGIFQVRLGCVRELTSKSKQTNKKTFCDLQFHKIEGG